MQCSLYWTLLYLTQFPLVPAWPFYEVKLVLIIIREDGNKTDIHDAQVVARQWVSYKTHIDFYCC